MINSSLKWLYLKKNVLVIKCCPSSVLISFNDINTPSDPLLWNIASLQNRQNIKEALKIYNQKKINFFPTNYQITLQEDQIYFVPDLCLHFIRSVKFGLCVPQL